MTKSWIPSAKFCVGNSSKFKHPFTYPFVARKLLLGQVKIGIGQFCLNFGALSTVWWRFLSDPFSSINTRTYTLSPAKVYTVNCTTHMYNFSSNRAIHFSGQPFRLLLTLCFLIFCSGLKFIHKSEELYVSRQGGHYSNSSVIVLSHKFGFLCKCEQCLIRSLYHITDLAESSRTSINERHWCSPIIYLPLNTI